MRAKSEMRLDYQSLAPALNGTELGTSRWITVDQGRIDAFAGATEDQNWLHTDPYRAALGPFGSTVAHGFLTLSLVAPVIEEVLEIHGAATLMNYGLERVRFPAPLRVDSELRGHAILDDVAPTAAGHRLSVTVTMRARGLDKPVCVATVVSLVQG